MVLLDTVRAAKAQFLGGEDIFGVGIEHTNGRIDERSGTCLASSTASASVGMFWGHRHGRNVALRENRHTFQSVGGAELLRATCDLRVGSSDGKAVRKGKVRRLPA